MNIKVIQSIPFMLLAAKRYSVASGHVQVTSQKFVMILSAMFTFLLNKSFFSAAWQIQAVDSIGAILFFISLVLLLWLLTVFFISLLCFPVIVKSISIFLLIGGAFAAYFMDNYGVVIDREMLRNAWETDSDEVRSLVSLELIAYIVIVGILPSLLIIKTHICWKSPWYELTRRAMTLVISLFLSLLLVLSLSNNYSSFFRNHKEVRLMANPLGFVNSGISLMRERLQQPVIIDPISQDATLGVGTLQQKKPVLVVFVVGETARAANFGLGGYKRDTTPLLAKQDVIYFDNFSSCGTSTAVSVPCIFSSLSRSNYSDRKAKSRHGLLNFIDAVGIDVLWRDNNSGCKDACDQISYETSADSLPEQWCKDGNCYDEVLLHNLSKKITGHNQFIVLHQKGSHGPAYDQRYPDSMRFFTPVCTTNQLHDCSSEELINAYDNSIRYTDYFLNKVIGWLVEQQSTYNTLMVYVSDHGESLGENRLYLHGMPYAIAPKFQTHVPFTFWASKDFYRDRGLGKECLANSRRQPFSHDNIFHSFLGLLDIKTDYYQSGLDIFSSCIGKS